MKNRSRLDIAAAILDVANDKDGALKTELMYRAFLSFPQINEYLEILLSRGLLKYTADRKNYHVTDLGKRFLDGYKDIGRVLMPKSSMLTT